MASALSWWLTRRASGMTTLLPSLAIDFFWKMLEFGGGKNELFRSTFGSKKYVFPAPGHPFFIFEVLTGLFFLLLNYEK